MMSFLSPFYRIEEFITGVQKVLAMACSNSSLGVWQVCLFWLKLVVKHPSHDRADKFA